MKPIGTNTDSRTSVMAMIGATTCAMAFLGRGNRREVRLLFHHALDILHHDDGVVDDDADGKHQRQERNRVGRIAEGKQHREGPDDGNRHGDDRNERRPHIAQEQKYDNRDKNKGFDQRMDHRLDRVVNEVGRVVHDLGFKALGHARLQFLDLRRQSRRRGQRIGARREEYTDGDRRLTVEAAQRIVILRAKFDARDILDFEHGPVGIGTHDDVAELLCRRQPALSLDVELKLLVVRYRSRTDAADWRLNVLGADRSDDVRRHQAKARQAFDVEPRCASNSSTGRTKPPNPRLGSATIRRGH